MFAKEKNAIFKVPVTEMEVLKSGLMGMFEKKRMANFYKDMDKTNV